MTVKGHMVLALLPIAAVMGPEALHHPVLLGAAAIGAVAPDIDEPGSYIGRRLPFLAYPLRWIGIKHRTLTHWLIFPLALLLFALPFRGEPWFPITIAFIYGIFMHDIGDMLTKRGIRGFFWPLFPKMTTRFLPRPFALHTGGWAEYLLVSILIVLTGLLLIGADMEGLLKIVKTAVVDMGRSFTEKGVALF
ncbi:metal-dependent hydrolase [Hydrogenimonas sp.]